MTTADRTESTASIYRCEYLHPPSSRHGWLNPLFQAALDLPSYLHACPASGRRHESTLARQTRPPICARHTCATLAGGVPRQTGDRDATSRHAPRSNFRPTFPDLRLDLAGSRDPGEGLGVLPPGAEDASAQCVLTSLGRVPRPTVLVEAEIHRQRFVFLRTTTLRAAVDPRGCTMRSTELHRCRRADLPCGCQPKCSSTTRPCLVKKEGTGGSVVSNERRVPQG